MNEIFELALQAVPNKTGYWVPSLATNVEDFYRCSECGRDVRVEYGKDLLTLYPYCHCGAKMTEI